MKRAKATHEEVIQINDWLREHRKMIEREPITAVKLASRVERELGFRVSDATIRRLAYKEGIKLAGRADRLGKDRVYVVARSVLHLYEVLGEPASDDLMSVAGKR